MKQFNIKIGTDYERKTDVGFSVIILASIAYVPIVTYIWTFIDQEMQNIYIYCTQGFFLAPCYFRPSAFENGFALS